jgi:hypothetical protein
MLSKWVFTDFSQYTSKKGEDIWNKKQRRHAGDIDITSEERK